MSSRLLMLFVAASITPAWAAGSGADALLNAVDPVGTPAANSKTAVNPAALTQDSSLTPAESEIRLTDPFLMQFFADWKTEKSLSFEANSWALRVLKGQPREAAHLWTAIQSGIPESFRASAQGAQLYLLWKLDLAQTFLDEWLERLKDPGFRDSPIARALEQTIASGFSSWVVDRALTLSPEQEKGITSLPLGSGIVLTLKAWAALRKGQEGAEVLTRLPANHPFKIHLGRSVALALARQGDLSGAARVLKKDVEPAIEATQDPKVLATHYLQVARLLYQAGALEGAEQFYEKIPNSTPEFLRSREELTWVWLRKGDFAKLRGGLTTLSSKIFDDRFAPEVHLVRAISNLKLCYYESVRQNFQDFTVQNANWAKKIATALRTESPPAPSELDFFSLWSGRGISQRTQESLRLGELAQESIAAVLPAVGPQQHWTRAKDRVLSQVELLKKRQSEEYRRQWKNQELELSEAIRKMKFVKVELLSQVRQAMRADQDAIVTSSAAAIEYQKEREVETDRAQQIFKFDGVVWPDELFKLKAVAPGNCLGQRRQ